MNAPKTDGEAHGDPRAPLPDPYLEIYRRLHPPIWRPAVLAALALSALGWMLTRRRP